MGSGHDKEAGSAVQRSAVQCSAVHSCQTVSIRKLLLLVCSCSSKVELSRTALDAAVTWWEKRVTEGRIGSRLCFLSSSMHCISLVFARASHPIPSHPMPRHVVLQCLALLCPLPPRTHLMMPASQPSLSPVCCCHSHLCLSGARTPMLDLPGTQALPTCAMGGISTGLETLGGREA